MTLTERLGEYVRACFTGLWIESHEHEDALREMAQLCADQNWQLVTWNIDSGLAYATGSSFSSGVANGPPYSFTTSSESRPPMVLPIAAPIKSSNWRARSLMNRSNSSFRFSSGVILWLPISSSTRSDFSL